MQLKIPPTETPSAVRMQDLTAQAVPFRIAGRLPRRRGTWLLLGLMGWLLALAVGPLVFLVTKATGLFAAIMLTALALGCLYGWVVWRLLTNLRNTWHEFTTEGVEVHEARTQLRRTVTVHRKVGWRSIGHIEVESPGWIAFHYGPEDSFRVSIPENDATVRFDQIQALIRAGAPDHLYGAVDPLGKRTYSRPWALDDALPWGISTQLELRLVCSDSKFEHWTGSLGEKPHFEVRHAYGDRGGEAWLIPTGQTAPVLRLQRAGERRQGGPLGACYSVIGHQGLEVAAVYRAEEHLTLAVGPEAVIAIPQPGGPIELETVEQPRSVTLVLRPNRHTPLSLLAVASMAAAKSYILRRTAK